MGVLALDPGQARRGVKGGSSAEAPMVDAAERAEGRAAAAKAAKKKMEKAFDERNRHLRQRNQGGAAASLHRYFVAVPRLPCRYPAATLPLLLPLPSFWKTQPGFPQRVISNKDSFHRRDHFNVITLERLSLSRTGGHGAPSEGDPGIHKRLKPLPRAALEVGIVLAISKELTRN
eukprot:gene17588-biopygen10266